MRIFKMFFAICLLISSFSFTSHAEGLSTVSSRSDDQKMAFKYYYDDRSYIKSDWKQVTDKWFYFGEDGISLQNTWAEIDGKWYYFDHWSIMLHDTTTPDGYQVGSDGAWIESTGQLPESTPETVAVGPGTN